MTMDIEKRALIDRYLDGGEAEFNRILAEGESQRRRKMIRWSAVLGAASAAVVALVLWLVPTHKAPENPLTPAELEEKFRGLAQYGGLTSQECDEVIAEFHKNEFNTL